MKYNKQYSLMSKKEAEEILISLKKDNKDCECKKEGTQYRVLYNTLY